MHGRSIGKGSRIVRRTGRFILIFNHLVKRDLSRTQHAAHVWMTETTVVPEARMVLQRGNCIRPGTAGCVAQLLKRHIVAVAAVDSHSRCGRAIRLA